MLSRPVDDENKLLGVDSALLNMCSEIWIWSSIVITCRNELNSTVHRDSIATTNFVEEGGWPSHSISLGREVLQNPDYEGTFGVLGSR